MTDETDVKERLRRLIVLAEEIMNASTSPEELARSRREVDEIITLAAKTRAAFPDSSEPDSSELVAEHHVDITLAAAQVMAMVEMLGETQLGDMDVSDSAVTLTAEQEAEGVRLHSFVLSSWEASALYSILDEVKDRRERLANIREPCPCPLCRMSYAVLAHLPDRIREMIPSPDLLEEVINGSGGTGGGTRPPTSHKVH
jgi:hypothetical protein